MVGLEVILASEGLCVSLELGSIGQDTSMILLGGVRGARFVRVLRLVTIQRKLH